jgi:hypothetical protein
MGPCVAFKKPFDDVTKAGQTVDPAGVVNNRTWKTAVNPLTRLASRSVMRPNCSVVAR